MSNSTAVQQDPRSASILADSPALFVAFYGPLDWEQRLVDHLVATLDLVPTDPNARRPNTWESRPNTLAYISLDRFQPAATHDTTTVQLALDGSGGVPSAWMVLHDQLQAALPSELLKSFWGYTIVYQAVLSPGAVADDAFNVLRWGAWHLRVVDIVDPLAHADAPGGHLWLLDIPIHADGLGAAAVYVALSEADAPQRLVRETLFGRGAALLMPDLISHKAYFFLRQYADKERVHRIEQTLDAIRTASAALVADLNRSRGFDAQLRQLAHAHNLLLSVMSWLSSLHINLAKQLRNFAWWRGQVAFQAISDYHYSHIETAVVDLELSLAEGRSTLETARAALDMVRIQFQHTEQKHQLRIQQLLSIATVALATAQIVNLDAARGLVDLVGIHVSVSPTPSEIRFLLGVQAAVALILALVFGTIVLKVLLAIWSGLALISAWLVAQWQAWRQHR